MAELIVQCVGRFRSNKRPDQPTFHYHLGAAWLKKGSIIKASQELQTALSHRPSPDEIGKIKELLSKAGA